MLSRSPNWRKYQEELASFFRTLGMDAAVCVRVDRARAIHEIDVLATFQSQGLRHSWAAECKRQRRPVTKADVETFKSIVTDIGAHRGFVLSESGFQAGAIAAARKTNITLTNLIELRDNAEPEVLRSLLEALEQDALLLQERLKRLRDVHEPRHAALTMSTGHGASLVPVAHPLHTQGDSMPSQI